VVVEVLVRDESKNEHFKGFSRMEIMALVTVECRLEELNDVKSEKV
jgi:hypothetical protein